MTQRQCEIAAEAYAACLLAQAGYDVLVQYGANQPQYDLVAVKGDRILRVSVKGSQDGGWMLAVRYKEGKGYRSAIDSWLKAQHRELVYVFVQFIGVALGGAPRAYVSRPPDIAAHLRTQRDGKGGASLQEDIRRDRPRSRYSHKIPASWAFSRERIDGI
jgi:Holliday junction resolvase-like predicted endonuclease